MHSTFDLLAANLLTVMTLYTAIYSITVLYWNVTLFECLSRVEVEV